MTMVSFLRSSKLVTKIVLVFNLNVPQEKNNIFKIFKLSLEAEGPGLSFSAAALPSTFQNTVFF